MSKKKRSEAGAVVVFFQTVSLDVARSILDIYIETVAARAPKVDKTVKTAERKSKKADDTQPPLIS